MKNEEIIHHESVVERKSTITNKKGTKVESEFYTNGKVQVAWYTEHDDTLFIRSGYDKTYPNEVKEVRSIVCASRESEYMNA